MNGIIYLILAVAVLGFCGYSMINQVKARVKGQLIRVKISGYTQQNGEVFAQYVIEHNGETLLVSDGIAEKTPTDEEYREVYWVPGDKYAYRPEVAKPMSWQILGCIAALVIIVIYVIKLVQG